MCQSPVYAGGWASIKFFVNCGVEEGEFVFARLLMLLQVIKCVLHFPSFFFFCFQKSSQSNFPILKANLYWFLKNSVHRDPDQPRYHYVAPALGLCDHAFVSLDFKSQVIIIFESTVLSLFKALAKTNRTISDFELQCSRLS